MKILNTKNKARLAIFAVVLFIFFLVSYFDFDVKIKTRTESNVEKLTQSDYLQKEVLPENGVELPVVWGDIGKKLTDSGVIDSKKFEGLYNKRGGLDDEEKSLLYAENNGKIIITKENSGFILNIFWALGLSNKNSVLEKGPMMNPEYGGAENFASTGGWTIANGNIMNHYSAHSFVVLTKEQQELVERVSKNIYRPCCGNSTYFPDCNHGMAMLGLLELMASQGVSEQDMYKIALQVNSFWFPGTYLTIAKYFGMRNVEWKDINPKEVLGEIYSSGQGYKRILQELEPEKIQGGGGCSA
ncbi:MAG: hypothetical protein AAB334_01675 [Patescibacteria group bacterium]